MSDNIASSATMKIQLSPTPQPSSSERNPKKSRKKGNPLIAEQEAAKNVLFEKLMNDPHKKRMVLQLLHDNRAVIEEYQRTAGDGASPINKLKTVPKFDSPTALMKRRLLEKQKKQQQAHASNGLAFEKGIHAITPSRKPAKKTLLKGVVAYVEVKDLNNVDKSEGVKGLLSKMGAAITNVMTHATHVIYKDGRYETYKRAKALKLPVVSILWLDVMDRTGFRVPSDNYPALGDYQSINACNELVERLENNGKPTKSRRKTLNPSHDVDIDDDLLAKMTEFSDDTSDIIENSQPESEPSCTSMMTKLKLVRTLRAQDGPDSYASDESESSKASGASGASSVTPIIAGQSAGRSRRELNAADGFSKSLLESPFINKNKRAATNLTIDNREDDKENSPVKKPLKSKTLQGMFQQITQGNARFETHESQDEPTSEQSPAMESPVASTPNVPRRTRRTLLPPELLGIVTEETNVSPISMELTNQGGSCERSKKTDKKLKLRKTNISHVSMDITHNLVTNSGENTNQENNETFGGAENVSNVHKKRNDSHTSINGRENEDNREVSKSINRASTSSTNTTKSDDLMVYTVKRRTTRQSVLLTAANKQNSSLDKDTNASLAKLSLRISEGAEPVEKSPKNVDANLSAAKNTKEGDSLDSTSSNNLSIINKNGGSALRRITRRMSTQIRLSESAVRETVEAQKTYSAGVDLSLKSSENSRGSGVPSLRLSPDCEKSKTSTTSDAAAAEDSTNNKSGAETNAIDTPDVPVTKDDASPITNISRQLFNTSISQKVTTDARSDASMLSRSSRTYDTASTSYSIIDNSDASRGKKDVTRSRSARASVISDVPTSASRETPSDGASRNMSKSANTTKTTTSTATSKRKLRNPDELLDDQPEDADEAQRKERAQDVQTQRDPALRRRALQERLDALRMPTQDVAPRTASDDEDFQDGVGGTQKSQPLPTQATLATRRRCIVCTRFHNAQIGEFRAIVDELGDFRVEQNVNAKTTHLVAMEASRTLNFLRAMSRGIWILRADWLFDSRKAGKWLDEDAYEMIEFSPFVQQHRLQREAFGRSFCHDVFATCGKILVSATCHPSRRNLIDLIRLCKGEVTNDVDDAAIIIGGCPVEQNLESRAQVKEAWILDSITFGRCKKKTSYLIL